MSIRPTAGFRLLIVTTTALSVVVQLVLLGATARASMTAASDGPQVVAADGTIQGIDAVDPSNRSAGVFALYTPGFGDTTKTNQYGGEAVLQQTTSPGSYRVIAVCTAFESCPTPGNNTIPDDGVVLSASPGGTPDVRTFLRDHVRTGDTVTLANLATRTVTSTVDAVDPTAANNQPGVDPASGQCYPGCRGAEQLVVYTPASGRPTTDTNDFGYEVTVIGDRVVDRGGNDREIPADGYVVSGHGGRGSWLSSNAVPGARVIRDGSTLTLVVDETTYIYGAEQSLLRTDDGIIAADSSCLDAPLDQARAARAEAEALLQESRAAAEAGETDRSIELAGQAKSRADIGWYRTAESRPVEGRGIWVRPVETTQAQIEGTLDKIAAAGLNMVFLETVWQGYTIYPSDVARRYGIAAQRPNMAGIDPLRIWTEEAHERGIELHPWAHTFFVGVDSAGGPGPVLERYPEWAAVEREDVGTTGPQPSSQEPGYYFVDPAMPGPRAYIQELFREILTQYDVDGLHLDYIRYPVSQPWQTASFSYSDHAREMFEADHGVDPYTLTPDDPQWQLWDAWRERQVTSFVADVREMQRQIAPAAHVSAAVFPDPLDGLAKKFQNWADWVEQGYVDVLTGMSFGTSGESVGRDTAAMREVVGEESLLYTATYGPFRGSDPEVVLDQIGAVRDAGSDGAALFAYNQLSAGQASALAEGAFRTPARVPHHDLTAAARAGGRYTAARLRAAAGACVTNGVSGHVRSELRKADRWLGIDRPDRAADAYARAADRIGRAGSAVQAAFGQRVHRDLDMYRRWSERLDAVSR